MEARLCRPWLFFLIPLAPRYGTKELVDQASGGGPLASVSIDAHATYWFFGMTHCHSLSARLAYSQGPESSTASPAPGRSLVGPDPFADLESPPPATGALASSAERLTRIVFNAIGKPVPADPLAWEREQRALWGFVDVGMDTRMLLDAAERGSKQLGVDAAMADILQAGRLELAAEQ